MSHEPRRVFIRVEGGREIGLGHLTRCVALSECLAPDFACTFVLRTSGAAVSAALALPAWHVALEPGSSIGAEADHLAALATAGGGTIVVFDGYDFNFDHQQQLVERGFKVVVIDDFARGPFAAHLIINHGSSALSTNYREMAPQAVALCGTRYALLREPFRAAARYRRSLSQIRSVLICLGGSDPAGLTPRVLAAVAQLDDLAAIHVVLGAAYHGILERDETAKSLLGCGLLSIHKGLDAAGMAELMAKCRVAVTPASSVALEACAIGCGLVIGTVAENQAALHTELSTSGCALSIGAWQRASREAIAAACQKALTSPMTEGMVGCQSRAIDGRSGERVLAAFQQLCRN